MSTVVLNTLASAEVPSEGIQDALQTVLTGGTYVTIVYNDGSNTYTFDLSTEALMDYLGANFLTAGSGISLTYSDVGNTLTIAATGSGGMTNPMTTADDIIVGGSSGTPARLAKGANATVLTINGSGNVAWAAPASPGSITALTTSTARTATSDGSGTGTIADGTDFVPVTSADANNIIVLPTPTPKTTVALHVGATGYELRTNSPTTVGINGGTGAAAESAIPANTTTICFCPIATNWICSNTSAAGVTTTSEVAAP